MQARTSSKHSLVDDLQCDDDPVLVQHSKLPVGALVPALRPVLERRVQLPLRMSDMMSFQDSALGVFVPLERMTGSRGIARPRLWVARGSPSGGETSLRSLKGSRVAEVMKE
jgi:hypothetical protein